MRLKTHDVMACYFCEGVGAIIQHVLQFSSRTRMSYSLNWVDTTILSDLDACYVELTQGVPRRLIHDGHV